MLILSRNIQETIVIDGRIRVTIIGVSGKQVRLAIDASADIAIDRSEVHDRKLAAHHYSILAAEAEARA